MYVTAKASRIVSDENGKEHALLWGDAVLGAEEAGDGLVRGHAHGTCGVVKIKDLGEADPRLLEIYVIDVGQGDAILIRTPDAKWHLVDGGPPGTASFGASRFLAWKFAQELRRKTVALETAIVSHSDRDHYGGLTEIFTSAFPRKHASETPLRTTVERFLHAGVAKYGDIGLGVVDGFIPCAHLLGDRQSFVRDDLADDFARFAAAVAELKDAAGGRTIARRVVAGDPVDGYGSGDEVHMRILGPVPEADGRLRSFGQPSLTVNGHSVVLRLDYGSARILLTGDTNAISQRHLLGHTARAEFAADVIKAGHHGSDDVDAGFLRASMPRVTVISSGDSESYSHPRPMALGAYAYYGRRSVTEGGDLQPPMMYSTEIARSLRADALGKPAATTFGLVNIRTDGEKVVCAIRNEAAAKFDVEELQAGREVKDDRLAV